MDISIKDYHIISKLFSGTSLNIILQHKANTQDQKMLELKEVAGFIEVAYAQALVTLQIDEAGGDFYATALADRLSQPAVAAFPEARFFVDEANVQCSLHVCARSIVFHG